MPPHRRDADSRRSQRKLPYSAGLSRSASVITAHSADAGVAIPTHEEWMGHKPSGTSQAYADSAPSDGEADLIPGGVRFAG